MTTPRQPRLVFEGCFYPASKDTREGLSGLTRAELREKIDAGAFNNLPVVPEHYDMPACGRVINARIDEAGNAYCRFTTEGKNGDILAQQIRSGSLRELSLTHSIAVRGEGEAMVVDHSKPNYLNLHHIAVTQRGKRANTYVRFESEMSENGGTSLVVSRSAGTDISEVSDATEAAPVPATTEVAPPAPAPTPAPAAPASAPPSPISASGGGYRWVVTNDSAVRTDRNGAQLCLHAETLALLRAAGAYAQQDGDGVDALSSSRNAKLLASILAQLE